MTIRPDFCRDMWLRKSCSLGPQVNMAASGREYGFLWLQRCCCLRQKPNVAASGHKSPRSPPWAIPKNGQFKHCYQAYDNHYVYTCNSGYKLTNSCKTKLTIFGVAHCDELGLLRLEAATVGCCRRQQHLWSHRNPYSRPEAAIFSCGQRPQDFLSHMSRPKSGLWSL